MHDVKNLSHYQTGQIENHRSNETEVATTPMSQQNTGSLSYSNSYTPTDTIIYS